MHDISTRPIHLISISLLAVALSAGCTDDSQVNFLGTWAYSEGMFELDCNGQHMQFPLDATLTETFVLGTDRDLSKADSGGCMGITFDVKGDVASLAPSPQSCMIPNMGTSVADVYTITISDDGDTLTASSSGMFTPMGSPGACTFVGGGTLAKQ